MLRINCPHCGLRDETEFRYGGEMGRTRPSGAESSAWVRYLYWRQNSIGEHAELWLHASGCRRWLKVKRDTATNAILSVCDGAPVGDNAPRPESAV